MNGFISIIAKLGPKPEPTVDPITALRNENEARLLAEKNTTRRSEILAEQKRLTTAALRKGVQ